MAGRTLGSTRTGVGRFAAVLQRTRVFAFGGMPPERQVQAFDGIVDQPDAAARFRAIIQVDSNAGKLDALAALRVLDPAAGRSLQAALVSNDRTLLAFDHDVAPPCASWRPWSASGTSEPSSEESATKPTVISHEPDDVDTSVPPSAGAHPSHHPPLAFPQVRSQPWRRCRRPPASSSMSAVTRRTPARASCPT